MLVNQHPAMQARPWAEIFFWRHPPSPRALRVWTLVLLLAPAAWLGGLALRYEITQTTWPASLLDRPGTLRQAAIEARHLGVDTTGWRSTFELRADPRMDGIAHGQNEQLRSWLFQNLPPRAFLVGFRDPKSGRELHLDINPRGELTGFAFDPGGAAGCPPNPASDFSAAHAVLERRFARWPALLATDPALSRIDTSHGARLMRYSWPLQVPELPGVDLRLDVEVHCGQVVSDRVAPEFHAPAGGVHTTSEHPGEPILGGLLAVLFLLIAVPWIAVRYVKRTIQGEAPQGRILLAGAIFAVAVLLSVIDQTGGIRNAESSLPLPLLIVVASLGIGFVAILFGMAYAAVEGEVRELYPGTLTSLDALLTGRWFTRNAGVSVLLGMALGGWLLLATQAAALLHGRRPVDTSDIDFAFARIPWLSALMKAPFQAVLTGVFGFLVPLALFQRWTHRAPQVYRGLVFVATAIGFALTAPSSLLPMGAAIWGIACALCLSAAFLLAGDLLAGLAALAALRLGLATGVLAAATPGYRDVGILAGCALATAAAAWYAARYGRVVSDAEVRPRYAANLAERLRLEREIDATRVAQQRLLPAAFPELPGLTAAGVCLPAREVAGDFYDAFVLSGGRLAVLLAEGGGQRMARALSIALVKGYLMQKIANGQAPGEMLAGLHGAAGCLVEGSTGNLCLAVIDPRARTLRYARTGDWPAVLVRRTPASPVLPCAEAARNAGALCIYEGGAALEPGSLLLLYTDGVGRRGALVRRLRRDRFERAALPLTATEVVATVFEMLSKRARRRLTDDLTLVAVRLDATDAARQVEVA
jgi:hypothetical protein